MESLKEVEKGELREKRVQFVLKDEVPEELETELEEKLSDEEMEELRYSRRQRKNEGHLRPIMTEAQEFLKKKGEVRPKELTSHLGVSPPRTSSIANDLEEMALIERVKHGNKTIGYRWTGLGNAFYKLGSDMGDLFKQYKGEIDFGDFSKFVNSFLTLALMEADENENTSTLLKRFFGGLGDSTKGISENEALEKGLENLELGKINAQDFFEERFDKALEFASMTSEWKSAEEVYGNKGDSDDSES